MNMDIEEVINSLKGIASIIITMSTNNDNSRWNDWALFLLYNELAVDIEKLEIMVGKDEDD